MEKVHKNKINQLIKMNHKPIKPRTNKQFKPLTDITYSIAVSDEGASLFGFGIYVNCIFYALS